MHSLWVFITTVQRQETGNSPAYRPGRQITLNGTGVQTDSSTCYIHSETFKLMPRMVGRTTITRNKAHSPAQYRSHIKKCLTRGVTRP